ncbi:hypothetical protein SAMN04489726_7154 [Allokutzneria albata]|uniref:Uncharacterized protein n=2 Tax=Allokutzneria albata TaxID=211114 RepID=A0A1H0CCW2_ALLAB|nr:hypothetical protein SAMN04489726_7154 [Allokutzneria albata]
MCERGVQFGEVVDKGSGFPVAIALARLGLVGTPIVLRLRTATAAERVQQPLSRGGAAGAAPEPVSRSSR